MHRPSDTFDTCWLRNWHRHWLVVWLWSCPGSTTAILCSTALQATASRSCSEYRTTQLGSFSRLQDDPTLAVTEDTALSACSAEDRIVALLTSIKVRSTTRPSYLPSPSPGPTTQPHCVNQPRRRLLRLLWFSRRRPPSSCIFKKIKL